MFRAQFGTPPMFGGTVIAFDGLANRSRAFQASLKSVACFLLSTVGYLVAKTHVHVGRDGRLDLAVVRVFSSHLKIDRSSALPAFSSIQASMAKLLTAHPGISRLDRFPLARQIPPRRVRPAAREQPRFWTSSSRRLTTSPPAT